MMTLIIFIIALSILVTVHEWGHFIVAKKSGVRVDVFSVGFGPKLFGVKWHGTEYRIAPFPFGGYVKIYGQEPLEEADGDPIEAEKIAKDPESFHSKPLYKKLGVVFAGPFMNLVLCFLVMPMVFMIGRMQPKILNEKPVVIDFAENSPAMQTDLQKGDLILSFNDAKVSTWKDLITQISLYPNDEVTLGYERNGQISKTKVKLITNPNLKQTAGYLGIEPFEFYGNEPLIDSVRPGSPAEKGGLKAGDLVVSLDGQPVRYWTRMTAKIQKSEGKPLEMIVDRGGQNVTVTVTPEYNKDSDVYIMGITKKVNKENFVKQSYGFVESVKLGTQEFAKLFGLTIDILGRLFTGQLSIKTLGGPLQIAQATSSAAKSGMGDFLYLLAFLSMQLGILNLLPIPILDGGHVVFMAIEGIRRKPLSPKFKSISMQLGLVMLLGLMLLVTVNDVDSIWGFSNILEGIKGIF